MWTRLILILSLYSICVCTPAEIKFTLTVVNNTVSCTQTLENPHYATIVEDEQVTLSVMLHQIQNLTDIDYFECFATEMKKNRYVANPKYFPRNSATSINVRGNMSGIWRCRILFNKYAYYDIEPPQYYFDGKQYTIYTVAYCYVKVHVRLSETPQIILVNNMIVPTTLIRDTILPVDHSTVYKFLEGESVDVACIPGNNILSDYNTNYNYSITFQYDYAEKLDDMFKEGSTPSDLGYGFRTKLGKAHHNSKLNCKCIGQNDFTIIEISFVRETHVDSHSYIEINGLISKPLNGLKDLYNVLEFVPQYLLRQPNNSTVDCVCNTNHKDYYATKALHEGRQGKVKTVPLKISGKIPFQFTCGICNVKGICSEYILGNVMSMSRHFEETKTLTVELPTDNILIELYKHDLYARNSWIYYEFDENDNISLNCTKSQTSHAVLLVKYRLNKKDIEEKDITLTSNDDKSLFECYLVDSNTVVPYDKQNIYKNITVLFSKKVLPSTTTMSPTTRRYVSGESESVTGAAVARAADTTDIWAIRTTGL